MLNIPNNRPKLKPKNKLSGKYAIANKLEEKKVMAARRKESFTKITRANEMLHFKLQNGSSNTP